MARTVRDTIKIISQNHLKKGNLLFGQCLTAVGWVGGTVPELTENDGLVELSMADVMGGGVVVGAALAGKRPIYVVRYQGFQWFNSPIIANYTGKTKELWGVPAPIFIRSIGMEGGCGPVAGSSHHGLYFRMPGIDIVSPMTPMEYEEIYNYFMIHDNTMYVSEHRKSYDNDKEILDVVNDNPDVVLFPFSITRFAAMDAASQLDKLDIKTDVYHQLWINPLKLSQPQIDALKISKYGGVVLDDDYPNGIAKQVAYELMLKTGKPVKVLCIDEKTAGFQPHNDNLPPSAEKIVNFVKNELTINAK
jgi:acetoin:2,6-dichlorophenolindophenol oxidoreductase subunit beta